MLSGTMQARYLAKTYDEIASRVSSTIATSETDAAAYYELIGRKRFIPAGNTLLAGVDEIRPNCCVLPSINEENFIELSERAKILWADRIGIGFDLSTAEKPVDILRRLSEINASIKFDHRPQRGNMAVLNASHPKIRQFIGCKSESSAIGIPSLYNFNISVGLNEHHTKDIELMAFIAESAWKSGDPGIVLLDRIQKVPGARGDANQLFLPELGEINTVVPCGENSMWSDEVCTLGSINLACSDFWPNNTFDVSLFKSSVILAVRFLDDVIDKMDIRDPVLKEKSLYMRRLGLGLMGWADVLHRLNMPYGSEESYELAISIATSFKEAAHKSSLDLGAERGTCPILQGKLDPTTGQTMIRRNVTITCIAPTGGITLLTDNKGFGIEPFFQEANGLGTESHLRMQQTFQSQIDNCISKTINMPNQSTSDDVLEVWNYAIQNHLKSITMYRDGSKEFQPMQTGTTDCPRGVCDVL